MINIKGTAIANDGNMKRIAITYDVIDESGSVIEVNKKKNVMIVDDNVLNAVSTIEQFAQNLIDSDA